MTGKEFIKGILDIANQFNTFKELFNYYVERVDRTPGLNSDIHNHSGRSR